MELPYIHRLKWVVLRQQVIKFGEAVRFTNNGEVFTSMLLVQDNLVQDNDVFSLLKKGIDGWIDGWHIKMSCVMSSKMMRLIIKPIIY